MLHKVMQDVRGRAILARDGAIGSVEDVYFDDQRWGVRYFVVDTRSWLPGRRVLISPASIEKNTGDRASIRVALTRGEVEESPEADTDQPVSRQFEAAHARYYRYNYYWMGPYLWGQFPFPGTTTERADTEEFRRMKASEARAAQSHLRSVNAVAGDHVQAMDGSIGHIEDFMVADDDWAVTGLIIDTRNWLPGKKVIVPPSAVRDFDWVQRRVVLRLTRDEVRSAQPAQ